LVYDSTKITSSNEYHTVPSGTLINNNIYKWRVTTYSGLNSANSQFTLFYAYSTPTLVLGATPTSVQTFNFSALYNSSENIPVKNYQAYLYLSATPTLPIQESGYIFPTGLISTSATPLTYEFDGMESDKQYGIRFTCENQHGNVLDTGISNFNISYTYPPSIPSLIVSGNNANGTIDLDWSALKYILGFVDGTYSYVTGKFGLGIQLDAGSKLYYNTETIPEDYTTYLWLKIPSGYSGILAKFGTNSTDENGMQVFFVGNKFGFKMGNYLTIGRDASNLINSFVLIGVKYGKLIIKGSGYQEILTMLDNVNSLGGIVTLY